MVIFVSLLLVFCRVVSAPLVVFSASFSVVVVEVVVVFGSIAVVVFPGKRKSSLHKSVKDFLSVFLSLLFFLASAPISDPTTCSSQGFMLRTLVATPTLISFIFEIMFILSLFFTGNQYFCTLYRCELCHDPADGRAAAHDADQHGSPLTVLFFAMTNVVALDIYANMVYARPPIFRPRISAPRSLPGRCPSVRIRRRCCPPHFSG